MLLLSVTKDRKEAKDPAKILFNPVRIGSEVGAEVEVFPDRKNREDHPSFRNLAYSHPDYIVRSDPYD